MLCCVVLSLSRRPQIFDLLIRLRQAVCHPYLVMYSAGREPMAQSKAAKAAAVARGEGGTCGLCSDPLEDGVLTGCGHPFCRVCMADYVGAADSKAKCPTCNKKLTVDLLAPPLSAASASAAPSGSAAAGASSGPKRKSILSRIDTGAFKSSTKIEGLREELANMLRADPSAKALVFSQARGGRSPGDRSPTAALCASNAFACHPAVASPAEPLRSEADRSRSAESRRDTLDSFLSSPVVSVRSPPCEQAQFTSMLELIQFRLERAGVKVVRLDGSMTLEAREKAIDAFNNDNTVTVFLMSLKAGGVALNLTAVRRRTPSALLPRSTSTGQRSINIKLACPRAPVSRANAATQARSAESSFFRPDVWLSESCTVRRAFSRSAGEPRVLDGSVVEPGGGEAGRGPHPQVGTGLPFASLRSLFHFTSYNS